MDEPSGKPRVIAPPSRLPALGPLVVVEGECAYLPSAPGDDAAGRPTNTAFSLPGSLSPVEYQQAMALGMRRSGTLVYRPLCPNCRRCQPLRIDLERFTLSRSQKRVVKRCDSLFQVTVGRPIVDDERLALYARYQADQHGKDGQSADAESYARFLLESVADTWELAWRDQAGKLVGVGVVDAVPDGLSTVYFYWEPALRDLSLGTYSALWEMELGRRWGKRYYYLGYLVAGSKTMSYKADFAAGEVWDGDGWVPLPARGLDDSGVLHALSHAEASATRADARNFRLSDVSRG